MALSDYGVVFGTARLFCDSVPMLTGPEEMKSESVLDVLLLSFTHRCYFVLTDMIPEVKSMFYRRILECLTMHFPRSAAVNIHAISVFIFFLRVIDLAP